MVEHILSIDLGTSGPKVALFTMKGDLLGWEVDAAPLFMLPDGGAEQNPDDWWAAIVRATRRLLARGLVPPESITALVCTAQWGGTVAVDRTGRHLMNAVIWADARGAPYMQAATSGPVRILGYGVDKLWRWLRITGGIPTRSGKDPIAHILFLKHERPEVYRAAYKFLDVKDALNARLSGRFVSSPDTMTVHWVTDNRNIHAINYDAGLLDLVGMEREKLPDLAPAASVAGALLPQVAAELGLSPHVRVIVGSSDLLCAAVGSGAVLDFAPHIYIGTSAWLMAHTSFRKTDLLNNMATLPAAIPGRYILVNEQDVAGGALSWLKENILYPQDALSVGPAPDDAYLRLNRLVEATPPGSDKVIFTPWLNGERSPVEDHRVRGGFHNLSLRTTRAHLARAVMEGVALNLRWLRAPVEKNLGRTIQEIRMVGGGAQSSVWCQICADILDRPILQVESPRLAVARGAALIGLLALGEITVEEIPQRTPVAATFYPNPALRGLYDELFHEFVAIYKKNKGIYARLNR